MSYLNKPELNAGLKLKQCMGIVFGKLSANLIEEILSSTDYFCQYITVDIAVLNDAPYHDFEQFLLKYYEAKRKPENSNTVFTATLSVAQIAELSLHSWVQQIRSELAPVFALSTILQTDALNWESMMRTADPEEVNDIIVLNTRQIEQRLQEEEQEQALSEGTPWQRKEPGRSSNGREDGSKTLQFWQEAQRLSKSGKPTILIPGDDQIPLDFGVGFSGSWRTNPHRVHWNNQPVLPFRPEVIGTHDYSRHDFPITKGRAHAKATIVNPATRQKYKLETRIGLLGCLQDDFWRQREKAGVKNAKTLILYEPTWKTGKPERGVFRRIIALCYGRVALVQAVWLEGADGSMYALMDVSNGPYNAATEEAALQPTPVWITSPSNASLIWSPREKAMLEEGFMLCELPQLLASCTNDRHEVDCSMSKHCAPNVPFLLYSVNELRNSSSMTIACTRHRTSCAINKPKMHTSALEAYNKAKQEFQQYPFKLDSRVLVALDPAKQDSDPEDWWLLVKPQHYPKDVYWMIASSASSMRALPKSILRLEG